MKHGVYILIIIDMSTIISASQQCLPLAASPPVAARRHHPRRNQNNKTPLEHTTYTPVAGRYCDLMSVRRRGWSGQIASLPQYIFHSLNLPPLVRFCPHLSMPPPLPVLRPLWMIPIRESSAGTSSCYVTEQPQ